MVLALAWSYASWPVVLLSMATLAIYYYVSCRMLMSRYPPGPFPLPLLGNLLLFQGECIHSRITELSKIYGPLLTIWLGPKPLVVACNADAAKEILVTKGKVFAGRPKSSALKKYYYGNGVASCDFGTEWKRNRRLVHTAVQVEGDRFEHLHGLVEQHVDQLINDMSRYDGKPFQVTEHTYHLFISVVSQLMFARKIRSDSEEYKTLANVKLLIAKAARPSLLRALLNRLSFTKRSGTAFLGQFSQMMKDLVKIYKSSDEDRTEEISLAKVLADENKDDPSFTIDSWPALVGDIYVAATDSSYNNINWTLLYLTTFPEKQTTLQNHIDSNWGDTKTPLYMQKDKFAYVEAVYHESLRYSCVLSLALPHKSLQDATVFGHPIPGGTSVFVNHHALNFDPAQWDQPEEYKPERFINRKGKFQIPTDGFYPFSAGMRSCIGQSFGRLEQYLIILKLFREFTFKFPTPDNPPSLDGERAFSWQPKDFELIAIRRHPPSASAKPAP